MKEEKSKYTNVELKTSKENFVLLSSKKHIYNLYVKEFITKGKLKFIYAIDKSLIELCKTYSKSYLI